MFKLLVKKTRKVKWGLKTCGLKCSESETFKLDSESKCCGPLQEVTGPSFYHFFLTERNRALAEPQEIKRLDVHIYIFRLLHWRWIHQACPFNGQLGRVAMLNKWNASFLLHSKRNRKKVFVNVSLVRGRCNAQSHIISVLGGKKWHLQNESLK